MMVTTTLDRSADVTCHKAGCAHLNRIPKSDYLETFYAASKEEVAGHVYADQARESDCPVAEYIDFISFAPCVQLPRVIEVAYIDTSEPPTHSGTDYSVNHL